MQEWVACDGMKRVTVAAIMKYASDGTISHPIVKLAQRQSVSSSFGLLQRNLMRLISCGNSVINQKVTGNQREHVLRRLAACARRR